MCDLDGCGSAQTMPPIQLSDSQRRAFLAGLASLPLASVLAFPDLAQAAGMRTEMVSIAGSNGATFSGALAMPKGEGSAPTLVLIHEWWGLNDQIKAVAAEFAELGYVALAIDLHGGKVAANAEEARTLTRAVNPEVATAQLVAAIEHLRGHPRSNGKVGTIGWCFGGGWSLNASLAAPVDATVIYYGNVTKGADQLASLNAPVLGHFGTQDRSINEEMVGGFSDALAAAGKSELFTPHWYDANHAFANPTGARFDAEDAALAWERTLAFFKQTLS